MSVSRRSFRDPATNVLKAHGYVLANDPGDLQRTEADSFNLAPGFWRWNGVNTWVPFTPPPIVTPLKTALDNFIAAQTPANLLLVLQALRNVQP